MAAAAVGAGPAGKWRPIFARPSNWRSAWLAAAVMGLAAMPLLAVRLAEALDGCGNIARGDWLLIFAGGLLIVALAGSHLAGAVSAAGSSACRNAGGATRRLGLVAGNNARERLLIDACLIEDCRSTIHPSTISDLLSRPQPLQYFAAPITRRIVSPHQFGRPFLSGEKLELEQAWRTNMSTRGDHRAVAGCEPLSPTGVFGM